MKSERVTLPCDVCGMRMVTLWWTPSGFCVAECGYCDATMSLCDRAGCIGCEA